MPCKVQQSVRANCVTYEKGRIYFNYFNTFYNVTREEAKRRAELYSALAEGKIIQFKQENGEWVDLKMDLMCGIAESFRYRIKPEPKYRPFKTQEECWNEMLKHQPFGWLKGIEDKREVVHIGRVFEVKGITLITLSINEGINNNSSYFFNEYTFADGTPFGIKEE